MEKKVVTTNRKAFHNFAILETYEAGIVLTGYEVKSLRRTGASLVDSVIHFNHEQAYMENVHIEQYAQQSTHVQDYNPRRSRKILLHKSEIKKLFSRTREKGLTLVPLEIYFTKKNIAKVSIGLAKGKTFTDKRETLRRKAINRDMERDLK